MKPVTKADVFMIGFPFFPLFMHRIKIYKFILDTILIMTSLALLLLSNLMVKIS